MGTGIEEKEISFAKRSYFDNLPGGYVSGDYIRIGGHHGRRDSDRPPE
jgi:hypothetical protein